MLTFFSVVFPHQNEIVDTLQLVLGKRFQCMSPLNNLIALCNYQRFLIRVFFLLEGTSMAATSKQEPRERSSQFIKLKCESGLLYILC